MKRLATFTASGALMLALLNGCAKEAKQVQAPAEPQPYGLKGQEQQPKKYISQETYENWYRAKFHRSPP